MNKAPIVIAVVVTYNRCELLKKCIKSLKTQSYPLTNIIVVNNGSTDGTLEWLMKCEDIIVVTQENIGGSGGFYRGIKEAYDRNADYIWAMDDDVNPTTRCLEAMIPVFLTNDNIGIVVPQRQMNGKIVVGETVHFNLKNPFTPLKDDLTLSMLENCKTPFPIEGMAFEGPLIKRVVVDSIGLPKKDLFIFWDDSDYSYRAFKAGYAIMYNPLAILNKEYIQSSNSENKSSRNWKVPYGIRNEVYFCHEYAVNTFFRIIKPLLILCRYVTGYIKHRIKGDRYYSKNDLRMIYRSYRDGISKTFGKY